MISVLCGIQKVKQMNGYAKEKQRYRKSTCGTKGQREKGGANKRY